MSKLETDEEQMKKLKPIIQNTLEKTKGFSSEELQQSGMLQKVLGEMFEDLNETFPNQENKKSTQEIMSEIENLEEEDKSELLTQAHQILFEFLKK